MQSTLPALISISLTLGVLLITFAVVRLRRGGDVWDRVGGGGRGGAEESRERGKPVEEYLNKRLRDSSYAEKLARKLVQADVRLTPAEYIVAQIGGAAVGGAVGAVASLRFGLPIPVGALIVAAMGYKVPSIVLWRKKSKRVAAYNAQLADSTMMLANSLRAGYSLLQSMDLISKDAPRPTSTEFRRVVQEVGVGLPLGEALSNLLRRVPSEDLDLMITAITVQQEVGGNLSQVLEGIAHTIRERVRIKGEIKVLTSQGRYSGYVITALPIGMALLINVLNPEYMKPLWSFPWIIMPIISLVLIGVAYLIIRKIVNIEV